VGLSAQPANWPAAEVLAGTPRVTDSIHVRDDVAPLSLVRHVRAFFQGNRYLVEALVHQVTTRVTEGAIVDLYAGGGLFGLSLLAAGADRVTFVEGDPIGSADLQINTEPYRDRARVERTSVEEFLARHSSTSKATLIVDPPRTGLSREAVTRILALTAARLVYVSCDVATLARDARILLDSGYALGPLTALDLFPNTAHVETVTVFTR
jgi:23S rRNA (uracil1939-C5)-methyltransferase